MSLLSIVQGAAGELGLTVPTIVQASTDPQVTQLMALTNRAAKELAREYPWQAIREEFSFATLAQAAQTNAIAPDFDRWVANSFWNRTTRRPIRGPLTPRNWQALQGLAINSNIYLGFVERQGQLLLTPIPPAAQMIWGEYVSKNICLSAGGIGQTTFLQDADTSYLDEDLIQLGLIWRWREAKGLDYAEKMNDYERAKEIRMARDGGATELSIAPGGGFPTRPNVPETGFGS